MIYKWVSKDKLIIKKKHQSDKIHYVVIKIACIKNNYSV